MICPNCKKQLADNAKACPQCGYDFKSEKKKTQNPIFSLILVFILAGFIYMGLSYMTAPSSSMVQDQIQNINNSVADDAVAQYNIAKQQGDKIQICVQAGIVSSAYLQAQDQANYNKWKAIQSADCKAAGVPY